MKRFIVPFCSLISSLAFSQQFAPRYELVSLGKQVNTFHHEAAPVISPDGTTLYFFIHNHPENTYGKEGSQDIWVTQKDEHGVWATAKHLESPLNQSRSNQVFNVLPDGSLFIHGGRGKNDKGFSILSKDGRDITELKVKDFDDMEKGRFYGATISADAKHMIIYFSEITNSAKSDIYVSHAQEHGWSKPEKLKLSSQADEFGVFIAPDNKTLYFASDRNAPGKQGGADIYKTERLDESWNNWSEPVNMGRPINTAAADSYFSIDAAGNIYTSRANSRVDGGNLDLFVLVPKTIKVMVSGTVLNEKNNQPIASSNVVLTVKEVKPFNLKSNASGKFETRIPETDQYIISATAENYLPKEQTFTIPKLGSDTTLNVEVLLTPVAKKLYLTGTLLDKKTEAPIAGKVDMVLKTSRKTTYQQRTTTDGKYNQEIATLGWYLFTASAEGYLNAVDSVQISNEEETPVVKDLYLQKIEVGLTVRLKNIYFDFDKTTLKSASFVELNKVVDFLKQNKTVEVEIAGHTDSKGADEYNHNLSQGRSQSVVDYLISQGIEPHRLQAHGYGESKPIDTNDTEAGQANNRRVEFTILKAQ
jgi:OmpA-OmpF porin, OOP family